MQALQVLTTEGFDDDPDLVIWMYGTNDATMGVQVERYRQALAQVIKLCQARQAGLIVAGPPLVYGKGIGELALTQPYVETVRTLAKESNLLFADMSAALGRIPLEQPVDPETVLPKYVEEVGKYYTHRGEPDRLHPNALGHEVMGQALWQALLHDPVPDPLQPRGSWTLADKADAQPQFEILIYQPPTEVLPPPPMESVAISVLGHPGGWQRAGVWRRLTRDLIEHRIEDVVRLRTTQFAEDAGPMAHPIRPQSYITIDNFYTPTVYEKGSEVIRMIETIVGRNGFRLGT